MSFCGRLTGKGKAAVPTRQHLKLREIGWGFQGIKGSDRHIDGAVTALAEAAERLFFEEGRKGDASSASGRARGSRW